MKRTVRNSCAICGAYLEDLMPTDSPEVKVCFTCNLPYKVLSSGEMTIDLDLEAVGIAKSMFQYYKKKGVVANICPGAMTLATSPNNRTSEQDWTRWTEWFNNNPQLFRDSDMYKDAPYFGGPPNGPEKESK